MIFLKLVLTLNEIKKTNFTVNIIPHTQEVTTFGIMDVGDRVNIEVDLISRYLERHLHKE